MREARFHIVAVPTPVNEDHTPDLTPLEGASKILGRNLTKGSVVVYESTVYPGVTEDVCVPILEKESCLKCGLDFKIGYSPERINPGDKIHRLETIVKVVSGMDAETLDLVAKVYELVVEAGLNIALSLILINFVGITGLVIGTSIAMLFRTIQIILYCSKNIINRSLWIVVKRILVNAVGAVLSIITTRVITLGINNFIDLFVYMVIVGVISLLLIGVLNIVFFKNDFDLMINKCKNIVKK